MTLLHYDLPGQGAVLGFPFSDHYLDVPAEHVPSILTDPRWREATEDEQAVYTAAPSTRPHRKKVTNG